MPFRVNFTDKQECSPMSHLPAEFEAFAQIWKSRGYSLGQQKDGKPVVEGDCGQFYCDAVTNEVNAAQLMEHLRMNNPIEYARYREDALDDGINLDESQAIFTGNNTLAWVGA